MPTLTLPALNRCHAHLFKSAQTLLFILSLASLLTPAQAQIYTIGLLDQNIGADGKPFWQETQKQLNQQIPKDIFALRPLGSDCIENLARQQRLQFVIASPALAVFLQHQFDAQILATLQTQYQGHLSQKVAAAVWTLANRQDLNTLNDLKNQSLIASLPNEFAGYQMFQRALKNIGLTPDKDLFDQRFTNTSQAQVIQQLLNKKADIAVVRSGIVETLTQTGQINPKRLKLLTPKTPPFPFPQHSTSLYSQWVFLALNTPKNLNQRIAQILQNMPKNPPHVAQGFQPYYGWGAPQPLTQTAGLLKALSLPPYTPNQHAIATLFQRYQTETIATLTVIALLLLFSYRLNRTNQQLERSQKALRKHKAQLEETVEQRTEQLKKVNQKLSSDIEQRQELEALLRSSRNTLQQFYEIATAPQSFEQKLPQLMQRFSQHFHTKAALLFECLPSKESSLKLQLIECGQADQRPCQPEKITQTLTPLLPQLDLQSDQLQHLIDIHSNRHFFCQMIHIPQQPPRVLIFSCPEQSHLTLQNFDKELLRLLVQWLTSEILRQTIESEKEHYRSQLGKMTRAFTAGEMVTGFAHELNQPLTAALNYLSGCQRFIQEGNLPQIQKGIEGAIRSLRLQSDIIQRLRGYVQTGAPEQTPFDLVHAIHTILDILTPESRKQELTLTFHPPLPYCPVQGDPIQIEQVLLNLIRNAMEASPAQSTINIQLTLTHTDAHPTAQVCVIDAGHGIPETEKDKLFDPFHTTKPDGMGLGLAISKSIIEAHHSQLHVHSDATGTRFCFTLKCMSTESACESETSATSAH